MQILLADHRRKVRFALRVLLEQQPGWVIVGEAGDAAELFEHALALQPDLALVDVGLPGLTSTVGLPALRRSCPKLRIVLLGEQQPEQAGALAAVSDACASKVNAPERLLSVIRSFNHLSPG